MSFANEVCGGLTEARNALIRRRRQTSDASERAAIDAAISQLNDTVYTMLLLWGHTGQPLVWGRVCHPCGGPGGAPMPGPDAPRPHHARAASLASGARRHTPSSTSGAAKSGARAAAAGWLVGLAEPTVVKMKKSGDRLRKTFRRYGCFPMHWGVSRVQVQPQDTPLRASREGLCVPPLRIYVSG